MKKIIKTLQPYVIGLALSWLVACGDASAADLGSIVRLRDHAFTGDVFTDPNSPLAAVDYEGGEALAKITRKQIRRNRAQGKCLRWVRIALTKYKKQREQKKSARPFSFHSLPKDSRIVATQRRLSPGRSAADFKDWAVQNPLSLCTALGLANISELPYTIHDGLIFLYARGQCGFHKRWGHIEVVTNTTKHEVCSDHCRTVQWQDCPADIVLAPVKHCDWLAPAEPSLKQTPLLGMNRPSVL